MFGKVVNGTFIAPPVNHGNRINVYLDPEWLAENGYHELTEEEIASIKPKKTKPINFSKLAIMENLGEAWPVWKAKIEEAGMMEYFNQCTYLSLDHPKFRLFWSQLNSEERQLLLSKCRY